MSAFVDPRSDPDSGAPRPRPRTTSDPEELAELLSLCRESRLYEVERWIRAGKPLQAAADAPRVQRRGPATALEIALEDGNHALTLLLLCNGYDPNLERHSHLGRVLRSRRWELSGPPYHHAGSRERQTLDPPRRPVRLRVLSCPDASALLNCHKTAVEFFELLLDR